MQPDLSSREKMRLHTVRRAYRRFGVALGTPDYEALVRAVRSGAARHVGPSGHADREIYQLTWRGRTLRVVYDPAFDAIVTVLGQDVRAPGCGRLCGRDAHDGHDHHPAGGAHRTLRRFDASADTAAPPVKKKRTRAKAMRKLRAALDSERRSVALPPDAKLKACRGAYRFRSASNVIPFAASHRPGDPRPRPQDESGAGGAGPDDAA